MDGREVWKLPDREQARLRGRKVGFVFQFPSLMPSLTALDNVLLPASFVDAGENDRTRERVVNLLREVGLADKLDALPRQISAGQQPRVVIAQALMNEPELVLAGEPTSNLDEANEHEIMSHFQHIHQERGITMVLVTHTAELLTYGTHALHMAGGRIVR